MNERWFGTTRAAHAGLGLSLMLLASCGVGTQGPAPSNPIVSPAAKAPSSAASGPATSSAATTGGSQTEWDRVLAAAKQEGKVSLLVGAEVDKRVWQAFQDKYGIPMEIVGVGGGAGPFVQRVDGERKSGQFLWDVILNNPRLIVDFNAIGVLDALRPALIRPEVLDSSKWLKGFDAGWADRNKSLIYTTIWQVEWTFRVNRNIVPESQLNKIEQLWEPQWRGKIAVADPRAPSAGAGRLATLLAAKGEDKVRAFMRDQQLVLSKEQRQLTEWLVRGQYPIAIGAADAVLTEFARQGLDVTSIKPLIDDDPGASQITLSTGSVAIFNRPPHPNAAKAFINWFLGPEGQEAYSHWTSYNSRRLDVPLGNPEFAVDPNKQYILLQDEEHFPVQDRLMAIAREVFP